MEGVFSLDYRFDFRSAADEHHVRIMSDLMEGSPNPIGLECFPGNAPYFGQFRLQACGEIGTMECRLDSLADSDTLFTSTRARSHIARNQSCGFNIVIWLGGENTLNTAGRTHNLQTGDFTVMDTEIPFCARMQNRGHAFNFALPSSWERIGDTRLENIFGKVYPGQDRRHRILVDYVQHLRIRSGALASSDAARKLYDILALVLNPRAKSAHPSGLLALICNHIETHYASPELDPENVAVLFGISVRHLHRLFAANSTTFSEYLFEQRLMQAHCMLAGPHSRRQTILSIAIHCGFRDITHFARRFRSRYGVTPSELRQSSIGM